MIQDSVLGPHQEIITAKAADNKVLSKAQDGGIVSAILIYALEENIIDGTIVAGPGDEPWKPEPLVATTKKEILKMHSKVKKDGYTIVPLEVYILKGFAKIQIGLAKGKKLHDKRDDIAKKDQKREMDRASKIKY